MDEKKERKYLLDFYLIDVLVIMAIIVSALVLQFVLQEIPCPLCLLQRLGIMGMSFGFLLNLRFGIRSSHYALSLLSAMYSALVSLRQISLHIEPGDQGYGDALFGLHLYTWVFILSIGMVLLITLLLMLDEQFKTVQMDLSARFKKIVFATFAIVVVIMSVNIVTTFLECGLKQCPDNPTAYKYLEDELT